MNPIERAAARSPWARVNVGEKVFFFLALILLAIGLHPVVLVPVALCALATAAAARVPWRLYLTLVTAPAVFITLGIVPMIITVSWHGFGLNHAGIVPALIVMARSFVATATMMVFTLTTPMAEMLAWARRRGVPETLMHVVVLMYRMISTLLISARTMWDAQAMRLGHANTRTWISSVAQQAATLFVLAFDRARRLGEGLELRADPAALAVMVPVRPVNRARLAGAMCTVLVVAGIGAWPAVSRLWEGMA